MSLAFLEHGSQNMPQFPFRRPRGFVILVAFAAMIAAIIGAQAPAPPDGSLEKDTSRIVVELLKRYHFSRPSIDDEVSKKWHKSFIKALDPQKYYFEKSDIDSFAKSTTTLDDEIQKGDLTFAKTVFKRFLERSDERLKTVLELLKEKPDFTVDETLVDDPDHIEYPANTKEANERWRKRIKLDQLYMKVDGVAPKRQ